LRYTAADLVFNACSKALNATTAGCFTTLANRTLTALGRPNLGPVAPAQCAPLRPSGTPERSFRGLGEKMLARRLGIDFEPASNTLFYATASRGFKAGSASVPAATNNLQCTPATQESVIAYEAGVKTRLLDNKVELSAAAFHYDYR